MLGYTKAYLLLIHGHIVLHSGSHVLVCIKIRISSSLKKLHKFLIHFFYLDETASVILILDMKCVYSADGSDWPLLHLVLLLLHCKS